MVVKSGSPESKQRELNVSAGLSRGWGGGGKTYSSDWLHSRYTSHCIAVRIDIEAEKGVKCNVYLVCVEKVF